MSIPQQTLVDSQSKCGKFIFCFAFISEVWVKQIDSPIDGKYFGACDCRSGNLITNFN
jgi:hypothetical protein